MRGSHSVVTAWAEDRLVGLGNTLSDGHLVVCHSSFDGSLGIGFPMGIRASVTQREEIHDGEVQGHPHGG
jgi:hypothetical protein